MTNQFFQVDQPGGTPNICKKMGTSAFSAFVEYTQRSLLIDSHKAEKINFALIFRFFNILGIDQKGPWHRFPKS